MKKKYIFATDVDGTMLMDNGEVHPETLLAFKKAKEEGHIVVIATGRHVNRTKSLEEKMPHVNYFVCNNGALIYDVTKKEPILLRAVDPKLYIPFYNFSKKHKTVFKVHTDQDLFGYLEEDKNDKCTFLSDEIDKNIREHIKNNPKDLKLYNGQTITQLSIFSKGDFCSKYFEFFKNEFDKDSSVYLTNSFYIDLNPKNTSKWTGLVELAKKLDIPKENIVTFGDSGNDYEMLFEAKENGYAMGNSHKDLIKKIKPKIGTNNTNAIGLVINKYLKNSF